MFYQIGHCLKSIAGASEYIIDSFPVAVCDNIRISRCKLLKGKQWRGKQSSMRRYFYGVKVQVLINSQGIPVEFGFVPGCKSDVQTLKKLPLEVAPESRIYADAAPTEWITEDEACSLLGRNGKKLSASRLYRIRHEGIIPPSFYTMGVNGAYFFNKEKLMGL
jgi:hypothetical protein